MGRDIGAIKRAEGAANRERVRAWLLDHVGGQIKECALALGLSENVVGRHVKALREEWNDGSKSDDDQTTLP